MNRINRLKYTAVIAGAGLAVVLFSSGVYANTSQKEPETETEVEVLSFDLADNREEYPFDMEPASAEETREQSSEQDDVALSAGAGDVLDNAELLSAEETESDTEMGDEELQQDMGLSAGAGEAFDRAAAAVEDDVEQTEDTEAEQEEPQGMEPEPEAHWGYTNLGIAHVDNHLNIREEPGENGKLIGKLPKDAACEILEIDGNGWAHIKSGKVEGYCSTEFLYLGDAAVSRGHEVASMIAVVNTQTLKVREEPNTDSIVITLIPQEEELEVVDIMDNGWIKFLLDDEEAYVSGDYVDVEERLEKAVTLTELMYGQGVSNVRVDMVQYAKQFVGNPYVWGGTSLTHGTDCSGFTMGIYKKYGVSLPHHAASQAQMGTKVDYSSIQPGDLVFYAKNGSINHVAMYIGNGQVIHASSPKTGIKISSWNYRTPASIRRYLSN